MKCAFIVILHTIIGSIIVSVICGMGNNIGHIGKALFGRAAAIAAAMFMNFQRRKVSCRGGEVWCFEGE